MARQTAVAEPGKWEKGGLTRTGADIGSYRLNSGDDDTVEFGEFVSFGPDGTCRKVSVTNLASSADMIADNGLGVVVRDPTIQPMDNERFRKDEMVPVLRRGFTAVQVAANVVYGKPVCVANNNGNNYYPAATNSRFRIPTYRFNGAGSAGTVVEIEVGSILATT